MVHSPICPCCSSGRGDSAGFALLGVVLDIVVALVRGLARFVSGRVLFRGAGPWDARYLSWAPTPPAHVAADPSIPRPRSRWACRPGRHRQSLRLAVIAVGALVVAAPALAAALAAAAAVSLAVALGSRWIERAQGPLRGSGARDGLGRPEGTASLPECDGAGQLGGEPVWGGAPEVVFARAWRLDRPTPPERRPDQAAGRGRVGAP